jgi:hypothetical protein
VTDAVRAIGPPVGFEGVFGEVVRVHKAVGVIDIDRRAVAGVRQAIAAVVATDQALAALVRRAEVAVLGGRVIGFGVARLPGRVAPERALANGGVDAAKRKARGIGVEVIGRVQVRLHDRHGGDRHAVAIESAQPLPLGRVLVVVLEGVEVHTGDAVPLDRDDLDCQGAAVAQAAFYVGAGERGAVDLNSLILTGAREAGAVVADAVVADAVVADAVVADAVVADAVVADAVELNAVCLGCCCPSALLSHCSAMSCSEMPFASLGPHPLTNARPTARLAKPVVNFIIVLLL